MARKSAAKKGVAKSVAVKKGVVKIAAKRGPKVAKVREAEAILKLAEAIKALADAVASQNATPTALPMLPFSTSQKIQVSDNLASALWESTFAAKIGPSDLPPLSQEDILKGIRAIFDCPELKIDSDFSVLLKKAPQGLSGAWQIIDDDYKPFRDRGLALGPRQLARVASVKDFVGLIAWGLQNALPS